MPRPPMRMRSPFFRCLTTRPTKSPRIVSDCFFAISWLPARVAARCFNVTVACAAAFAIETSFFMANNADIGRDAATHKRFLRRLTMPHLAKTLKNVRILQVEGRKWPIQGGLRGASWVVTATFVPFRGYFGNDLGPTRPDSAVTQPPHGASL